MKKMKEKHFGSLLLLILCFSSVLILQKYYLNQDYDVENIEINTEIINRSMNTTYQNSQSIKVIKPKDVNQEKLPTCILIHGDITDSHTMNLLKLELLRNKYLVVIMDILEFDFTVYFLLNETLNYLQGRPDVNTSQIGIIGHSRGGHYALHFASMRNESINAVIVGNYGSTFNLYYDYFEYYLKNIEWNITTLDAPVFFAQWQNLTIPADATTPRNLLVLTDIQDTRAKIRAETFLSYLTLGKYNETNKFYGSFENKSARELFVSNSFFGHISSLFNPEVLYLEISWINQALGVNNSANKSFLVYVNVYFEIFLIILLIVFSSKIIKKCYTILLNQDIFFDYLLTKMKKKKSKSSLKFNKKTEYNTFSEKRNISSEIQRETGTKLEKKHEFKEIGLENENIQQESTESEIIIKISIILITFNIVFFEVSDIHFPDLIQYWIFWSLMLLILKNPIETLITEKKWRIYNRMDYLKFVLIGLELFPIILLLINFGMFDLIGDQPLRLVEYNYYYVLYFLIFEAFVFRIISELNIRRSRRISKEKG